MHGMPYQVDTYKLLIATYAKMGLLQVGTWVGVVSEISRTGTRKVYMMYML